MADSIDPITQPRGPGLFGDVAQPARPAAAAPRRATRFLVPLILFVLIIGGLAWLVQNMPNWRRPATTAAKGTEITQLLKFATTQTLWDKSNLQAEDDGGNKEFDKKKTPYAAEYERGEEGRYWYPFHNVTDKPVELSLVRTSCDCARLDVALVPEADHQQAAKQLTEDFNPDLEEKSSWAWQPLPKFDAKGFEVPPGAHGLVRLTWIGRKEPGTPLNLGAVLFATCHPLATRHQVPLVAWAVIRRTVESKPDRVHVGTLGERGRGEAEFVVWSATRDQVELQAKEPSGDPLFKSVVTPIPKAEFEAIQQKLREEGMNTRVRWAARVKIVVHEQDANRQLDQGPLHRALDLVVPDAVGELPVLLLTGTVKGDTQVGAVEDQGRIQLKSFRAADGIRKTVVIWADRKAVLIKDQHSPAVLEVSLKESKAEATPTRRKWLLEVVVPPNQHFGPFDDDHAVILRIKGDPPRRIRIPIAGNGGQG